MEEREEREGTRGVCYDTHLWPCGGGLGGERGSLGRTRLTEPSTFTSPLPRSISGATLRWHDCARRAGLEKEGGAEVEVEVEAEVEVEVEVVEVDSQPRL